MQGKASARNSPGPVSQETGNWRNVTIPSLANPDSWTHQNGRSPNRNLVGRGNRRAVNGRAQPNAANAHPGGPKG